MQLRARTPEKGANSSRVDENAYVNNDIDNNNRYNKINNGQNDTAHDANENRANEREIQRQRALKRKRKKQARKLKVTARAYWINACIRDRARS